MADISGVRGLASTPERREWCEHGEHDAPAGTVQPGQMDPAMGVVHIESICEDCIDVQVAAQHG